MVRGELGVFFQPIRTPRTDQPPVAPLVTFLPGARLTFGMVELAYGDMVSGRAGLSR
jgi:hypothetical protein